MQDDLLKVALVALFITALSAMFAVLIGLIFQQPAKAAEIRMLPAQLDGLPTIYLSGDLVEGDAATFAAIVKDSRPRRIVLNSGGGLARVGVEIAAIVHREHIEALVLQRNHCDSACFLIFAAAWQRDVFASSVVGVHRAAYLHGSRYVDSPVDTTKLVTILSQYGVPRPILHKLQSVPMPSIATLSIPELRSMGTIVEPEKFFVVGL